MTARRESEFDILRTLAGAGLRCSTPYLFGVTQAGEACFSLLGFIAGASAETALPALSAEQQYEVGLEAGRELRRLHNFSHPDQGTNYATRRVEKYQRYAKAARDLGVTFEQQENVRRYVEQRCSELSKSPVRFQHDDYHVGNLIVRDGKFAGVVDFNRCDWGDPVEDFYKLPWFSAPVSLPFARGEINGYLVDGSIEDFWLRYNLFVALSLEASLVWVHRSYPENTDLFLKRIDEIISTHDFNNDGPPAWYQAPT